MTPNRIAWLAAPAGASGTTITPAAVAAAGTVQTPTILASATTSPTTVDGTGSVPTPSIVTGIIISAVTVEATGSVPTPTVTATATISPSTVSGAGTVFTPTINVPASTTLISAVTVGGTGTVYTPHLYDVVAPVDGSTPTKSVPRARRLLGCGDTRALIGGRSLRNGTEVRYSSLNWSRVVDETSAAGVIVPDLKNCQSVLVGVEPWANSVVIVRDRELVWGGPITRMQRQEDQSISLTATDYVGWLLRRNIPVDLIFELIDSGVMARAVLSQAMLRDNPADLSFEGVGPSGVATKKSIAGGSSNAMSVLRSLTSEGFDFSVVGLEVYGGNFRRDLTTPIITVDASAFATPLTPELDGLAQANDVTYTGSGSGGSNGASASGNYSDWVGSKYGLLQEIRQSSSYLSTSDDTSETLALAARDRWGLISRPPVILPSIQLSRNFPGGPDKLRPGHIIRIKDTDPVFPVQGDYRLTDVRCEVGVGESGVSEKWTVTLQQTASERTDG